MPLNKLALSLAGTCHHCGQRAGFLQPDPRDPGLDHHPVGRRSLRHRDNHGPGRYHQAAGGGGHHHVDAQGRWPGRPHGCKGPYLYGNEINELPDSLFKDAGSFDRVLTQANPGGPFKLQVTLTEKRTGTYVAQLAQGSPFHVEVTLKATGANLSYPVADIYGGQTESNEITAMADGSGDPLRVEIDQVKFRDWGITNYSYYDEFELAIGTSTDATTTSETDTSGQAGEAERQTQEPTTPEPTATPVPTPEPTTAPSVPTNLVATTSDGSITISWTSPEEGPVNRLQGPKAQANNGREQSIGLRGEHWQHRHKFHRRLGDQRGQARLPGEGRKLGRRRTTVQLRQGNHAETEREATGTASMDGTAASLHALGIVPPHRNRPPENPSGSVFSNGDENGPENSLEDDSLSPSPLPDGKPNGAEPISTGWMSVIPIQNAL